MDGPSPRWRGDHEEIGPVGEPVGAIPALAGRPVIAEETVFRRRRYPRAGGETAVRAHLCEIIAQPSPRWRGDPAGPTGPSWRPGTIPALAGRPGGACRGDGADTDHPRAGGETRVRRRLRHSASGPSPRWRGDRLGVSAVCACRGTIPALAGRPDRPPVRATSATDHPRAGGETPRRVFGPPGPMGPSPRWRGDQARCPSHRPQTGTIPALAGRPAISPGFSPAQADHPRAGGETAASAGRHLRREGPSPRWRGDLGQGLGVALVRGTIPALAGRPRPSWRTSDRGTDHPRAGGETAKTWKDWWGAQGPSPRWRGDPRLFR